MLGGLGTGGLLELLGILGLGGFLELPGIPGCFELPGKLLGCLGPGWLLGLGGRVRREAQVQGLLVGGVGLLGPTRLAQGEAHAVQAVSLVLLRARDLAVEVQGLLEPGQGLLVAPLPVQDVTDVLQADTLQPDSHPPLYKAPAS